MEERRKHKRWPKRVRVRYWARGKPDQVFTAYTRDISEGGAFLQTNSPFRMQSRVQIEFITDHGGFLIEGEVARSISYPRELQQLKTGGMGVRFVPLRELIGDLMPSAVSSGAEESTNNTLDRAASTAMATGTTSKAPLKRRRSTSTRMISAKADSPIITAQVSKTTYSTSRKPMLTGPSESEDSKEAKSSETTAQMDAHVASRAYLTGETPPSWSKKSAAEEKKELGTKVLPVFPVRFESLNHFMEVFDKDLRFGGLFVSTEEPAALNETIELKMSLPESDLELRIQAQVVHVMHPETGGGGANLLAGMGVYFADPEAVERLTRFAESKVGS